MAEAIAVVGAAAAILQIADYALQTASRLSVFAASVKSAGSYVEHVSRDVAVVAATLRTLHEVVASSTKRSGGANNGGGGGGRLSSEGEANIEEVISRCRGIFEAITALVDKVQKSRRAAGGAGGTVGNGGGASKALVAKVRLTLDKVTWPSVEGKLREQNELLAGAKSSIMLIILVHQFASASIGDRHAADMDRDAIAESYRASQGGDSRGQCSAEPLDRIKSPAVPNDDNDVDDIISRLSDRLLPLPTPHRTTRRFAVRPELRAWELDPINRLASGSEWLIESLPWPEDIKSEFADNRQAPSFAVLDERLLSLDRHIRDAVHKVARSQSHHLAAFTVFSKTDVLRMSVKASGHCIRFVTERRSRYADAPPLTMPIPTPPRISSTLSRARAFSSSYAQSSKRRGRAHESIQSEDVEEHAGLIFVEKTGRFPNGLPPDRGLDKGKRAVDAGDDPLMPPARRHRPQARSDAVHRYSSNAPIIEADLLHRSDYAGSGDGSSRPQVLLPSSQDPAAILPNHPSAAWELLPSEAEDDDDDGDDTAVLPKLPLITEDLISEDVGNNAHGENAGNDDDDDKEIWRKLKTLSEQWLLRAED